MIGTPLAGNNNWRKVLQNFSLPVSVKHDSLLAECYNILVNGGYIDVELGTKLFESPNLSGISALADLIKKSRFGNYVYFNDNLHANTQIFVVLTCKLSLK
jgi:hypothetical protein